MPLHVSRSSRWLPVLSGSLILTFALAAAGSAANLGILTQLAGTDGCVKETPVGGDCADGKALDDAISVAVSPDGKHVYVASLHSDAVAVFARDKMTGALTQLAGTDGCSRETPVGGDCADGKALDDAISVAVSPDGKHVYVASQGNAVAVFARNKTTGVLTQLAGTDGCVKETPVGGDCADGKALVGPRAVAVSPDGKHVYVASLDSDAVAVFARNKTTGGLTQLAGTDGCVKETPVGGDCADGKALVGPRAVAVSPDGKHVYVASIQIGAVAVFARNKTTGALTQLAGTDGCVKETPVGGDCADGKALIGVNSVAVSPDGKHVYAASFSSNAVAVFARDKTTGGLTQLAGIDGCVRETPVGGDCADGKALGGAYSVAVSRDGKHVYVASFLSWAVAVFARDKMTGALTQLAGTAGCVKELPLGGDCADGKALMDPRAVAVSRDGKHVYVASIQSGAVAVFSRH